MRTGAGAELKSSLEKLAPIYPVIEVPTVVLVGDRDLAVSKEVHAFELAKAIPHARLEVLSGVGHVPHHARPDRVVAAVEEVLHRSSADAASPSSDMSAAILNPAKD